MRALALIFIIILFALPNCGQTPVKAKDMVDRYLKDQVAKLEIPGMAIHTNFQVNSAKKLLLHLSSKKRSRCKCIY